jgi:hypothetical protein
MPILTGKSSRALEEQIVLTHIICTSIFIEKELIQFFSLPFTCSFIIVQVYTLKIHLFGYVRCSSKITTVFSESRIIELKYILVQ